MSINDAIQHVRIDKACKLLRQSDDPVEQVAMGGVGSRPYLIWRPESILSR